LRIMGALRGFGRRGPRPEDRTIARADQSMPPIARQGCGG
jgi:hypothetical protein